MRRPFDRCPLRALPLAVWLAAAAPAWAEEVREAEAQTRDSPAGLVPGSEEMKGVRLYGEQTFNVLADFGPADVTEYHSALGLRVGGPLNDVFIVRARAVGAVSLFDYSGDRSGLEDDLLLDDLFDRLYDAEFALGGAMRLPFKPTIFGFTPTWSVFAEGSADLAWEDGASLSDAVSGSGALGLGFQLEPEPETQRETRLELAAGIDVGSKIDGGGVSVNPVVAFRWQIRDDMRLESQGLGLRFIYEFCPELQLRLSGSYDRDRYRLDDPGGAPARTLRQSEIPLLVALRWKPTKHWRFSAGAGSVVYQNWRVELDSSPGDGTGSRSESAGPAPLFYLRLEYRF